MTDVTPPVVRVVTANVDFAEGGDGKYVQQLCEWADVIELQEAKTFTLADVLPKGWVSLQDGLDQSTKGSCIAYDAAVIGHKWDRIVLGASPFIGGERVGLLPRYYQMAGLFHKESGRGFVAVSAHEPPWRFRLLQPGYTKRLAASVKAFPRAVVGADANMPIGAFASALGLSAYGKGIVGIATDLPVRTHDVRPWGIAHGLTDHPAVVCHVIIPKEKP